MKFIVYTALFGAYDNGLPEFVNTLPEVFEFHAFTNQKRLKSNCWQIHHVDELIVPGNISKTAYWYKWMTHSLFANSECDVAVWMDSSAYDIKLENIKTLIDEFIESDKVISIERHPSRAGSLRAEMQANVALNKDDVVIMRNQVEQYYAEGYSDSLGIPCVETGFSLRKFRNEKYIRLAKHLMDEMLDPNKTKRDQLVWNYSVWKTDFAKWIGYFSYEKKMNELVKFKDHPHREKHMEKVLLVGPWIGADYIESSWVKYVEDYVSKNPVDTVVVGCKKGHEHLYSNINADKIHTIEPKGGVYKHLVDGRSPRFDVKSNGEKELIHLTPSDDIISKIYRPNIHILWCTVRPQMMMDTWNFWKQKASTLDNIRITVGVDSEEQKNELISLGLASDSIRVSSPRPDGKRGVTWPSYELSSNLVCEHPDDIVVFASDDFFPMQNWDRAIIEQLTNFNGCLVVNDTISAQNHDIVSIPIMTYDTLVANNKVIYHPIYAHCFSDNELYDNMKQMGRLKDISTTIPAVCFEHRHWTNGGRVADHFDETQSKAHGPEFHTYKRRKKLPLSERLKVVVYEKQLSILVCSMNKRKHYLDELMNVLKPQVDAFNGAVEIIVDIDDGQMVVGAKRNRLLDCAKGEYVCFVDDDDLISEDYVKRIVEAIQVKPDCCSIEGVLTMNGNNPQIFKHSLKYKQWYHEGEGSGRVYYRNPNHLNTIHHSIASYVRFNDGLQEAEDRDFSMRVLPFLEIEAIIEGVLYHYRARSNKSETELPPNTSKKIISFSLWGEKWLYCWGALRNAKLAKSIYPGWTCRFYHDASVPKSLLKALEAEGAELVCKDLDEGMRGLMWRFEVAFDPDVEAFMVRDTDSSLNPREQLAVQEWMASDKAFHIMRDNPAHGIPILGGMWGAKRGFMPIGAFRQLYDHWCTNMQATGDARDTFFDSDQRFLNTHIWPHVCNNHMAHDDLKMITGHELPFKVKLPGTLFVGAPVDE